MKGSGLGSFGFEGGLGDLHQLAESTRIGRGEVSQNFSVEGDFGGFEALDKTAVGQARGARGRVDADLPQITESPFLYATIAEGILPAMIDGIGCIAVKFGAAHPEAFGGRDHAFASLAGSWGVGYAHIILIVKSLDR